MEKLEYGPAPESDSAARDWLAKHNSKFGLFINGQETFPEDGREYLSTHSPATGEKLADIMEAVPADVDVAVGHARTAFEKWSKISGFERARVLYAVAREMAKHARVLSVVESMDNGKTFRETRDSDVPLCIRHWYYHAGWAQLAPREYLGGKWKPCGVIAQVIPWNFPLLMLTWKIAPAIALGNTVVIKPAPSTRLSAMLFADICTAAGVPPGVINILPGGNDLGFSLVNHPDVDKVAFTGSTGVGKLLRESTAGTGKKLSLELGGKSPFIVFDTADLDSTVEGVVNAIWFNQGQVCCAGSRMLVQENIAEKMIEKLKRRIDNLRIGGPLDKCVDVGAMVNEAQLKRVIHYVDLAKKEGASVYQSEKHKSLPVKGFWYPPTMIYDVETSSKCVIDEIFGPVLTILTFRHPKEAVALANNTAYGLSGSIWSQDISLCLDIAFQVKAGVIWVNTHNAFDAAAGFGGYKESGFGREGGIEGLYEYVKPSWYPAIRNSFSKEELERPFGDTIPATPLPSASPSAFALQGVNRTYKAYIGGKQARPDGQYSRSVMSKTDGSLLGEVADCNRKDVRNAVEAAAAAAPGWGARAAYNRAQILYYVAENISIRANELSLLISKMTGSSEEESSREVQASIERLFYWAAYSDKHGGTVQETPLYGASVAISEAVGVIGIACPDANPLLSFVSLFAPAVVRGNSVVIIPSQNFPLCATTLYQVFDCSDVPPGVINILTGDRDHLTKYLAEHMAVDAMWYFGSAIGSHHVQKASAKNVKRTLVSYGVERDWFDADQGSGVEFLHESTQVKNIWIPAGI